MYEMDEHRPVFDAEKMFPEAARRVKILQELRRTLGRTSSGVVPVVEEHRPVFDAEKMFPEAAIRMKILQELHRTLGRTSSVDVQLISVILARNVRDGRA